MNLVMVSVALLAMLAFQPTLIYGLKDEHSGDRNGKTLLGKKSAHSHALAPEASAAKLVLSLQSGDVLVRAARGATDGGAAPPAAVPAETAAATVAGHIGSANVNANKRNKNASNHKKLNKNFTPENAPSSAQQNGGNGSGRGKHADKKFSAAANQQQQQQQQHQQHQAHHQHGKSNGNNNNNNKGKQRQLVKSQQHPGHGKRGNNGGAGKTKVENVEKNANGEKTQSTCRYAKSTWSDCDAKTNTRSRTLTLKKGDSHCPATRSIEKKCKKYCRYEKGTWSACIDGQVTRQDKLKQPATGGVPTDASCEPLRTMSRKCSAGGGAGKQHQQQQPGGKGNKERKHKERGSRRVPQQA